MTPMFWLTTLVVAGNAIYWHAMPRYSRPDILFAVTVSETFAAGAGRALVARYRAIVWSGAAAAIAIGLLLAVFRPSGWEWMLPMAPVAITMMVAVVAWGVAHRKARAHAVPFSEVRVASLVPRDTSLPGGPLFAAGPFVILLATAVLVYAYRDDLRTGPITIKPFAPLVFAGMAAAIMLTRAVSLARRSRQVAVDGLAAEAEQRFRRFNVLVLVCSAYAVAVALSAATAASIPGFFAVIGRAWSFVMVPLLLFNVGVGYWMFRVGQGFQKAVAPAARQAVHGDATPDHAWKAGGFVYFNPRDPAIWVEKRIGFGYTLNMGNSRAWLLIAGMMLAPMIIFRLVFALSLSVLVAPAAMAQDRGLTIEYTVKVADIPRQLFHVTTDIRNISQPSLDLSLPVWSPGWYVIENYGKNVARFRVAEPGGRALRPVQVRKQTWRIDTKGISRITVEFDYLANVLSANQARIAADYAFFTGTQLFLMPESHRSRPSVVKFDVPSGWKIASGLDETADPIVFTAPEYDTLVDQPTLMGHFDVTRFTVDGKPHDLVLNPPGVYSADRARTLAGHLSKLAETQGRIFGGLPYRKFVYFYLFRAKEAAAAVLEHQNSFVIVRNPDALSLPDDIMVGGAAHEFFHVWNVKRIRPVEMWPYDYSKENETPLLWVSEGFTSYYTSLSMYRAGLRDARALVAEMAQGIGDVEGNEARRDISAADSSMSTWIDYAAPAASRISYYSQGRNLAQLLDLSIRHDTSGARGLDEVMRALFTDFYQRGRGFSTDDLIRVVNRISGQPYDSFFNRYVSGTDVPPYDTFLGYAGYQLERATRKIPFLGVNLDTLGRVTGFPPGSDAATSRLQPDDFIVRVDDQTLEGQPAGTIFRLLNEKLGQNVRLRIRRGGEERELDMAVKFVELANYRIVESQSPTAEQLKIRESWLKR
jgi:predicted metalloprotease with PDZ domain